MPEPADWERLGALLQQQRVSLDRRYRNRALFCRERGINYRLTQDIETGARDNYAVATLTHIELAYGWQPGSAAAILAGGGPRTDIAGLPDITPEQRRRVLDYYLAEVRAAERGA